MSKVTELIEALKDGDVSVREKTAEKLGLIKDPQAVEPLIAVLRRDKDKDVRFTAAWALGFIKDPRAVKPLIAALRDRNFSVCNAAENALDKINPYWTDLLKK